MSNTVKKNSFKIAILLSLFVVNESAAQDTGSIETAPVLVEHPGPLVFFDGKQINGRLVLELAGNVYNWAYCTDENGNWLNDYLAIYTVENDALTERIISSTSCGIGKSWPMGGACYAGYLVVRETKWSTVVSFSSDGNDMFLETQLEMFIPYQRKTSRFSSKIQVMTGNLNYVITSSSWGVSVMLMDPDGIVVYNEQFMAIESGTETKEDCIAKAEEWASRIKAVGDTYSKGAGALSGLIVGGFIFEAGITPFWAGAIGSAVGTGVAAWDTFAWTMLSEAVELAIRTVCIDKLTNEQMQKKLEESIEETMIQFDNQLSGKENCVAVTSCAEYSTFSCTPSKEGEPYEECIVQEAEECTTTIECY